MTAAIPYTDVKVGDLVEVNTVTVQSGEVVERNGDYILLDLPGPGRRWVTASPFSDTLMGVTTYQDRKVLLINRPEPEVPPKPTLHLGQEATLDHEEPPVGSKLACVYDDGDSSIYTRRDGKAGVRWYPSGSNWGSTYVDYVGLDDHKHVLIHLSSSE